jgi:hypothetical protein
VLPPEKEGDEGSPLRDTFRALLSLVLDALDFSFLFRGEAEDLCSYDEEDPDMFCNCEYARQKANKI